MSKKSLTGYLNRSNDVGKLENLIFVQYGSAYYFPQFGIDRKFYVESHYQIQIETFTSYIRQMALYNGIVTTSISSRIENFTALIDYTVASDAQYTETNNYGVSIDV